MADFRGCAVAAGLLLVMTASACTAATTTRARTTSAKSSSTPTVGARPPARIAINPLGDPAAPRRIVYATTLMSDPLPDPPPVVPVGEARALAVASPHGSGSSSQQFTPRAALRLVTQGDPMSTPAPTPAPAWVVVWPSRLDVHGPPTLTRAERAKMVAAVECVEVVVVDARSGTSTSEYQACVPRGTTSR
jgi:hypothetical protein